MEKEKKLILDVDENPKKISHWILFALQHIFAMLVACITVPILTGLPIAATVLSAGVGTIIYLAFTKFKSPVFLSSSFAYLTPMAFSLGIGMLNGAVGNNYLALMLGMIMVGIVYVIVAVMIKFVGTNWLSKLLPPVVIGPVIIVIGLSLASSAISNLTTVKDIYTGVGSYNLVGILCGLIGMFVTCIVAHYCNNRVLGLIPFIFGVLAGYAAAFIFTIIGHAAGNSYFIIIDYRIFKDLYYDNFSLASIFNYKMFVPNNSESFIFLRFNEIKNFDWSTIGVVFLLFVPVSLVTICEHIGDHENLGQIIGKDLLREEPGMKRTLMGDGVATAVSGVLCGAANTTYGENVAVIGTTKIASVKVVALAALMAIGLGLFTPFTTLLSTIPNCVIGGISLILYGFIASSGFKMLNRAGVDLNVNKNIFVMSAIMVIGIGGLTISFVTKAGVTISITSVAASMIIGIILNAILKEKKEPTPSNEALGVEAAKVESEPKEIQE